MNVFAHLSSEQWSCKELRQQFSKWGTQTPSVPNTFGGGVCEAKSVLTTPDVICPFHCAGICTDPAKAVGVKLLRPYAYQNKDSGAKLLAVIVFFPATHSQWTKGPVSLKKDLDEAVKITHFIQSQFLSTWLLIISLIKWEVHVKPPVLSQSMIVVSRRSTCAVIWIASRIRCLFVFFNESSF